MKIILTILPVCVLLFSCNYSSVKKGQLPVSSFTLLNKEELYLYKKITTKKHLELLGLVNIHSLDTTILVDLKYSTTDNFMHKILYNDLREAYLRPEAAAMLVKAREFLNEEQPGMRLIVYDAVRPMDVQKTMFASVQHTPYKNYIADPSKTGLHNYGMAVDLSIIDSNSQPLDMGTPFDFFGKKAGIANEQELIRLGILSREQVKNRQLLRKVMIRAGFQTVSGEWWHFNACNRTYARQHFSLIETFDVR